ncbi:hypothetical protein [Cerasicoccus maritimus]|uniref:hypothetical protein n=1 Tax=Cerasicoccus maritimus TaxID=490089 RepID=UPI0028525A68|nr:hypothetical protein [Cerasicoccus maritimus]
MSRLEKYKLNLSRHKSDFVSACFEIIQLPLPDDAEYAGLYYVNDGRSLIPFAMAWMTLDMSIDTCYPSPLSRFTDELWEWSDEDLDEGVHEDAEEYLFQWASDCWNEAGGEKYSPLFVLYDQGSMDIYDLCTLDELTDNDLEQRLKNRTSQDI